MGRLYLALALVIALAAPSRAGEVERIRTHFARVLVELHGADTSALSPAQRHARAAALVTLEDYARRGVFPRRTGDPYGALRPRFIDDRGVHCAVGELIAASGHESLARSINREFEYAYVRDMRSPALAAWARDHGITIAELARIQPSYSPAPTEEATRRMITERPTVDRLTVECAAASPPVRAIEMHVEGNEHGSLNITSRTAGPFATCFVEHMRQQVRFGGAWEGTPEEYDFDTTVSLTTPEKLFAKSVDELSEIGDCQPRPGPVPRELAFDVTSDARGLAILVSTWPHNTEIEICAEDYLARNLYSFRRGIWTLHAHRSIKLHSPYDLQRFHDALRMYATSAATDCYTPAAPHRMHVDVSAHTDDANFAIRVDGDSTFAACVADKVQTSLHANYDVQRVHDGKREPYFRIDRDLHDFIDLDVESPEARDQRLERERKRHRHRYDD